MKKKITAIALVICLLLIGIIGATLSYFSDKDTKTNTFTFGKVDIELTEESKGADATTTTPKIYGADTDPTIVVAKTDGTGFEYKNILPGQVYSKKPTVKNIGDQPAYIGVEVELPGDINTPYVLCNYFNLDSADNNDIVTMVGNVFVGFDTTNWDVSIGVKGLFTTNSHSVLQFVYKGTDGVLAPNASIDLFNQVKIPEAMQQGDFADFNLKINAYAVQTTGLGTMTVREALQQAGFNHN